MRNLSFFVKIPKKQTFFLWGGDWVGGLGRVEGGQAGCERRIQVFVKIQKKNCGGGVSGVLGLGGRVGGVRVDVNKELKFL